MAGHDDGHRHGTGTHEGHHHGVSGATQRLALWIALIANGGFLVVEVVGGIAFGSLALLADAAHMVSDVVGLVIALIAQALAERPPTARHSFGLKRAEVLGAQVNGLLLVVASGWIAYEAIQRLAAPAEVDGAGLLAVATVGLLVNVVSAVVLARAQGGSLNMRGALIHMLADAAGSVAAMVAGIAVILWGADRVDPIASLLITALVLWATWGLLRDTTTVLLEGTPKGIDPDAVIDVLAAEPGVDAVHHLHLWSVASDQPTLSAHVVLDGEISLHEAQDRGVALKEVLADRFGIHHATLELECHPCAPSSDELPRGAVAGGDPDHDHGAHDHGGQDHGAHDHQDQADPDAAHDDRARRSSSGR